jgi:CRISPR-associated protein Cmr5
MTNAGSQQVAQTLQQRRAAHARAAIAEAALRFPEAGERGHRQRYATLARDLASRVRGNGLGQAVAFLMSKAEGKAERPEALLVAQLSNWLIDERKILSPRDAASPSRLIDGLLQTDRERWMRARNEAVAWLTWLKRFVEAFMPIPEEDDGQAASREATQEA